MPAKLWACRNCGILSTEPHDACPACDSTGSGFDSGGFRRVYAEEFLQTLE